MARQEGVWVWDVYRKGEWVGYVHSGSRANARLAADYKYGWPGSSWSGGVSKKAWGPVSVHKSEYFEEENPRKPSPRVGKALKKYVGKQLGLPKQWTPAEVRVNEKGQVQVKMNPAKVKGGVRNARNVRAVVGGTSARNSRKRKARAK